MRFLPLIALLCACGQAPEPTAPAGTLYGEALSDAKPMKISEVVARADELEGKKVKVEGMVTGVCAKRGCWFSMASDEEFQSMTFKVTDGVIVFPMSAKGKYAVAEGTVQKLELTLEQTRNFRAHKAEEAGEEFDPESVTEPMTIVRLQGLGAVISERQQP